MLLIYFDRPLCPKHHKPYQYFCLTPDCTCPGRLCSTCCQEHTAKFKKGEYLKGSNYNTKLAFESELIAKQYEFCVEGWR